MTTKDIVLPKAVDSLENWGGVLITMDAWKKDKISFEETISMAEQTDKMKKYLNFILAKFGKQACEEPPTQAVDLAMNEPSYPEEIYHYSGTAMSSDR